MSHAVEPRDAVVLLPFVQLLPLARRAFAARGGLLPRIETTRTLAASLGPPRPDAADAPTLDPAFDAVLARQMLSAQDWGAAWRRHDRRGFDRAAGRLVATAHAAVRACAGVAPDARDPWWAALRETLGPGAGPGGRERALARIALEWAALAPPPDTDRLFALRPAAWVSVQAGGSDKLVTALLERAAAPCLVINTDLVADIDRRTVLDAPAVAVCDGFEQEAQAAAAQVLAHLAAGERPVALVAADRVVVRRVRALLERTGARLLDETGWRLSTTRAAAAVMSLLVAAERQSTTDQLFEWLKSGSSRLRTRAIAALETACRKQALWRVAALNEATLADPAADEARRFARDVLAPLQSAARQPIAAWLATLDHALGSAGSMAALQADAAGRQVIAALGLGGPDAAAAARIAAAREPVSLADFTQWVDEVLELATFLPPSAASDDQGDAAELDVVITPLARAMLRPFAAAVVPGADDRHLGAWPAAETLLSAATLAALGTSSPAERLHADWLAFGHLLRIPKVTLLRRRSDGAEPLGASAFVDRLGLALAERRDEFRRWQDPGSEVEVSAAPVRRLAAHAPGRVPTRLSATAFDVLRACPYRFFATRMLGALEDAELDGDLEKRDYGSWLHDVLHAFHEARAEAPAEALADEAALRDAGARTLADAGFDAAEFLPWGAAFDAFVPRYVRWLRKRESGGAHWLAGEAERSVRPPDLEGVELYGIIDRIDSVESEGVRTLQLIDYKTGSAQTLSDRMRDRFEDTQLAFYAALVAGEKGDEVKATYLALEARPELKEIEHRQVAASAAALVEGVGIDLGRLRGGAGMLPLGEGDACRFCEARGLCRRDHWNPDVEPDEPARIEPPT